MQIQANFAATCSYDASLYTPFFSPDMKYRKEIDGLRALAVIPVILYHAGFTLFSGGYVGVDVFFVISGYLITTIIHDEILSGHFSIAHFYERRARRILPALFFICLVSIPFAWIWMLPAAFKDFGHSLIAVSLFSSNILFSGENDYFTTAAELKPLLHTWSLAVEEQFYLFFPLLLLLFRRLRTTALFAVLALISIASLMLADYASVRYPTANFYLLITRAWELGIGAMLAIGLPFMRQPRHLTAQSLSILGLIVIGCSIFYYDETLPFPGLWGLLPTLGTVLIIAYARPGTLAAGVLSLKPVVAIGLISYSAYLWHQPLFAFARISRVDNTQVLLLLSGASMLLASFSWRYIEAPFRNHNCFTRRQIFRLAISVSSLLIVSGIVISYFNGFDFRYNDAQKQVLAYLDFEPEVAYREGQCFLRSTQTVESFSPKCFSSASNQNSIAIWGDSHAAALSYGLRTRHPALTQLTASACSPLAEYQQKRRPNCEEINAFALQVFAKQQPGVILLHASWRDTYGKPAQSLESLLADTLSRIRTASPTSRIILLGDSPRWQPSLPELLVSTHIDLKDQAYIEPDRYTEISKMDDRIKTIARRENVGFISILGLLCKQGQCLSSVKTTGGYAPLVWDDGHLTPAASTMLGDKLLEIISAERRH